MLNPKAAEPINYLYFGFLFFTLALMHVFHVLLIDNESIFLRSYFVIYSIVQCLIEVLVLVVLSHWIYVYLPRFYARLFIFSTFVLFIMHVVDFPFVRLMDMSIWFILDFVSQESLKNIIEMFYASNISLWNWALGIGLAITLFFLGMLFFRITTRFSKKIPFFFSYRLFLVYLSALPLFLFLGDMAILSSFSPSTFQKYLLALPWKTTISSLSYPILNVSLLPHESNKEKKLLTQLETLDLSSQITPDIFLFVVESLREDFINSSIAPYLDQFKKQNISFEQAIANANATQISWFSLFYSKLPFYWDTSKDSSWESGSIPLRILKKMGYDIFVYSATRLSYYQMDERLFGKNRELLEAFHFFPQQEGVLAYLSDYQAFEKIQSDLIQKKQGKGRIFITFLESTHFDYTWPKETATHFTPIDERINYLRVCCSKSNLEAIKNRYRNAIHYVDSLFGSFFQVLKDQNLWDSSLIAIMSDHGEEFYEKGNLFHASGLSSEQTHIPIYYKLPQQCNFLLTQKKELTSHMDVFPTIFHCLMGKESFGELFEGQSILAAEVFPYVVSGRYNASRTPYEFFIHNGKYKMVARFNNKRDIFKSKKLDILSIQTKSDALVPYDSVFFDGQFKNVFNRFFIHNPSEKLLME